MGPVEVVLYYGTLAALLWFVVVRTPTEKERRSWARSYGLEITPVNERAVWRYLARSQRWRRVGFVLGWLAASGLDRRDGNDFLGSWWLLAGVGYSLGIVAAEATRHPRVESGAASLEPRHLDQYLPRWLTWVPRVLTAAVVVAAVVALTGSRALTLSDPQILVLAAVAAGVLAGAELIERAVVARRQPVSEPDLLAADDAMRTQSAHALAGAVIIAAGSLWSILLFSYGDELLGATARQTFAALLPAAAWVVGIVVQNLAWRVRRLLPAGPS
jgi:hypothetical protein